MPDEHQTSPGTDEHMQGDSSRTLASQDTLSVPAQLDIQLRATKPIPLPDPFQFAAYLAYLASSDSSQ